MRLSKIKLAGFKSFVDPTTFYVPSHLVGIVGPNGCGKSNLIDAVRWVMGESSARQLRGEAMTDVIFNGSSARKPVGQASIELVFENHQGRLTGPFGQYREIAVKRLVNRDGESNYFINNTRCRRRDITDLFLGTGLGPRSYAIIEQGMISRVVEARPEDLRLFIEEAAGISKYKERRRETEQRIIHTRDNLERVNDVREELARQAAHLQRQAQAAAHYQQYQAEAQQLKAELLALRWRTLDAEGQVHAPIVRQQELALDKQLTELRRLEAQIAQQRDQHVTYQMALQALQQQSYDVGTAITRLEQHLEHQRTLRQRLQEALTQLDHNQVQWHLQQQADEMQAIQLKEDLASSEQLLEQAIEQEAQIQAQWADLDQQWQHHQATWESLTHQINELKQQAAGERARIEQLERHLLTQERRHDKLRLEQQALPIESVEKEQTAAHEALQMASAQLGEYQSKLADIESQLSNSKSLYQKNNLAIDQITARLQAAQGRLAALETLQHGMQPVATEWLQEQGVIEEKRLIDYLVVEPGWERAVETVLGSDLQGIYSTTFEKLAQQASQQSDLPLILFDAQHPDSEMKECYLQDDNAPLPPPPSGGRPEGGLYSVKKPHPTMDATHLACKIQAPPAIKDRLARIRIVSDIQNALQYRHSLERDESLITQNGVWVGRSWLRCPALSDEHSLLIRQKQIHHLHQQIELDQLQFAARTTQQEDLKKQLALLEQQQRDSQIAINQAYREQTQAMALLTTLNSRLDQMRSQHTMIEHEWQDINEQISSDRQALKESRLILEELLFTLERWTMERQQLADQRDTLRQQIEDIRQIIQIKKQNVHQYTVTVETLRTQLASLTQAQTRLAEQQQQLHQRRQQLQAQIAAIEDDALQQVELDELLQRQIRLEEDLQNARHLLTDHETLLQETEQARSRNERQLEQLREQLEAVRVQSAEWRVRQQNVLEQADALNVDIRALATTLTTDADETIWQEKLDKVTKKIQRLGQVNLAAIEEHEHIVQRQQHLETQYNDLTEALTTLETAMRKMDRETKTLFQSTFDKVNTELQTLFPRLFGGGQAYLELTSDDVLEAGVTLMARPPGKRIGTLSLLSGGEKALTAIALVFSIFQLNPAPFCMLDEVDAPLDEANVARFCRLLAELAEQVQFIFITHNKVTMTAAQHLIGVTMQEPGVSRLVTVDVAEALRLVAV